MSVRPVYNSSEDIGKDITAMLVDARGHVDPKSPVAMRLFTHIGPPVSVQLTDGEGWNLEARVVAAVSQLNVRTTRTVISDLVAYARIMGRVSPDGRKE